MFATLSTPFLRHYHNSNLVLTSNLRVFNVTKPVFFMTFGCQPSLREYYIINKLDNEILLFYGDTPDLVLSAYVWVGRDSNTVYFSGHND